MNQERSHLLDVDQLADHIRDALHSLVDRQARTASPRAPVRAMSPRGGARVAASPLLTTIDRSAATAARPRDEQGRFLPAGSAPARAMSPRGGHRGTAGYGASPTQYMTGGDRDHHDHDHDDHDHDDHHYHIHGGGHYGHGAGAASMPVTGGGHYGHTSMYGAASRPAGTRTAVVGTRAASPRGGARAPMYGAAGRSIGGQHSAAEQGRNSLGQFTGARAASPRVMGPRGGHYTYGGEKAYEEY